MKIKDYQERLRKTLSKLDASQKELDKLRKPKVLKQIRLLGNWTLQEFGDYLGVSKQRVHFIESGKQIVSAEVLYKYLKFINEELSK